MKRISLHYLIVLLLGGLYFACNNAPTDVDHPQGTPPKDEAGDSDKDPSLKVQLAQAAQKAAENAKTPEAAAAAVKKAQDAARRAREIADQAAKAVKTQAEAVKQKREVRGKAENQQETAWKMYFEQAQALFAYLRKEEIQKIKEAEEGTHAHFTQYMQQVYELVKPLTDKEEQGLIQGIQDAKKELDKAKQEEKTAEAELEAAIDDEATKRQAAQAAEQAAQAASKAEDALYKR